MMDKDALADAAEAIFNIINDLQDMDTAATAMGMALGLYTSMYGADGQARILGIQKVAFGIGKRRGDKVWDGEAGE